MPLIHVLLVLVGVGVLLWLVNTYIPMDSKIKGILNIVVVVVVVLWLLGLVTSYTMGGFIHVLLVIAIVVVLINVIQGRKVL